MHSVPLLFRVLVHNSAVCVIYDTRNNLDHVRNLHIIGTLESYIFLLGWEDPLQEGMAVHSRILAWRILWAEEPGGLKSIALLRVRHD